MEKNRFFKIKLFYEILFVFTLSLCVPTACIEASSNSDQITLTNQDIQENWNMVFLDSASTTYQYANNVIVKNHYAYTTSHTEHRHTCPEYFGAFDVYDVSHESVQAIASIHGTYDLLQPLDLVIQDSYAYYSEYNDCGWGDPHIDSGYYIKEIDISNPRSPYIRFVEYVGLLSPMSNLVLAVNKDILYAFHPGVLDVYSIPIWQEPLFSHPNGFSLSYDIEVKDNYVYLLGEKYISHPPGFHPIFQIYDLSNPSAPLFVSETNCQESHSFSICDVRGYGRNLLLATDQGVQIFDITNPQQPIERDMYELSSPAIHITTNGKFAYVSSGISGVNVLDMSYPEYPLITGFYNTSINASKLFIQGTIVYSVDDISGLSLLRFHSGSQFPTRKPIGPREGIIGSEYLFNYVIPPTLPMNEFYVLWNWGDSTQTSWVGPYKIGEKILEIHSWETPGVYPVRIKIKDILGQESMWSEPLLITIR